MPDEDRNSRTGLMIVAVIVIAVLLLMPAMLIFNHPWDVHEPSPTPSTVLRIGTMDKVDSLNPYVGISDSSYLLYSLLYDSLTSVDQDLNVRPSLATGTWAVPTSDPELVVTGEPYGSVWQYNLTHQAFWSDGEPFTADDVVWNINLNAGNYTDLWAYQPSMYFAHYASKVDDYTVRVHFYDRASQEPKAAAYGYAIQMYMLPEHSMSDMDTMTIGYKWTGIGDDEAMPIVGTGPFIAANDTYENWLTGNTITLKKNPDYFWESEYGKSVKINEIELKIYEDTLAMQYALQNGQIDIAQFPPQTYYNLKKSVNDGSLKSVQTYDGPKATPYWSAIEICNKPNGMNPSRLDPAIRHAMAMATDKSHIVDKFYLGLADVGTTMISPVSSPWHYLEAGSEISYNLSAAAALLEANGYVDTNSDGIREATATSMAVRNNWVSNETRLSYEILVWADHPEDKEIAKWLKEEWKTIGIEANYTVLDPGVVPTLLWDDYYGWDLWIDRRSSELDPNLQLFVGSSVSILGWNDLYYHNNAYDENYSASVSAMNQTDRKAYVDNCQRIMYDDCNYIVMAYPYQTYAWRTDFWMGWGDWAAHPGRSLDNIWGPNPLLFDLFDARIYEGPII